MQGQFKLMEMQVAGLSYHVKIEELKTFQVGAALMLVREADNPHDGNAVRIDYHDRVGDSKKVGYVPRSHASIIAGLMDNGYGASLSAVIADVAAKRGICVFAITMVCASTDAKAA